MKLSVNKLNTILATPNNKHQNLIIIIFIFFLNFFIKGLYLDANPIEMDEPFSIFHAQMGISEIINELKGGNNPPLYEIFLHFWIKMFGISPFSVRFPSLLFGTLNVFFIYLISKRFFNLRIAILSVILVSFSNYHLFFSHEARVYTLFALLTTVSFYLLLLILENKYSFQNLFFLFITYVGLVFSHYFGLFIVVFQAVLISTLAFKKTDVLKKYFILIGALLLSYSYFIPIVFNKFLDSSNNGTWIKPVENLGNLFDVIFLFSNSNRWVYLVYILVLWGIVWKYFYRLDTNKFIKVFFLIGIIPLFFLTSYSIFFNVPFFWKLTSSLYYIIGFITILFIVFAYQSIVKMNIDKSNNNQIIITGWFLIPLLFFFIISFKIPVFLDRYLIFIMPAFYITLALSVNYLFRSKLWFILVSIFLISITFFSFNLNVSNNRFANKIINQTKVLKTNETKIIICPNQYKLTFAYHYNIESFKDFKNLIQNLNKDKIFPVYNHTELSSILKPKDDIIYIDAQANFLYPKNGIFEKLNNSYILDKKIVFQDSTIIYHFKKQ